MGGFEIFAIDVAATAATLAVAFVAVVGYKHFYGDKHHQATAALINSLDGIHCPICGLPAQPQSQFRWRCEDCDVSIRFDRCGFLILKRHLA
jgi:hypothetical protein